MASFPRLNRFTRFAAVPALAATLAAAVPAEAASRDGQSLFRESARRDSGYADFTAAIDMDIVPASGSPLKRRLRLENLESRGDGAKMLLRFENPPDVKGTLLLSHAHRESADEQWIYLPAFKRVKKISSAMQSSPFMASDFSYEDILGMNPRVEKYAYAVLPTEVYEGLPCFVIERKPKDAGSGYSRQVAWMDTVDYLVRKVESYGPDGALAKVLTIRDYRRERRGGKAAGNGDEKGAGTAGHWRAREMRMRNVKTRGETILRGSDYKLGSGLDARAFDPAALGK